MGRYTIYYEEYPSYRKPPKKYGFGHLMLDLCLTMVTGGLWLFVILIKYLRTH